MTTDAAFVLSPQQRRTWLGRTGVDGAPWRWTCDIEIRGSVDAVRLGGALDVLVARHEILRTTYRIAAGLDAPTQVIGAARSVDLAAPDVWREPAGTVDGVERPLAAGLIEDGDGAFLLRLQGPAPSVDFAGITRLAEDIAHLYHGGAIDGGTETLQYADVAEWLNELLHADDTAAGRDHWRRRAASPAVPVRLPFQPRHADGGQRRWRGGRLSVAVPAALCDLADPRHVLLSAWAILLHRYGAREEMLLAVGYPGRRHPALENAIGAFTRYVPVALTLHPDTTVEDAIGRIGAADAEAAQYQDYFSRELWQRYRSGPDADLDVGFDYHVVPELASGGGSAFRIRRIDDATELFDLSLRCRRTPDGIEAAVEYDAGRVEPEDVASLGSALEVLLDEMLRGAGGPIGEQRLAQPRPSRTRPPAAPRVADLFDRAVRRAPSAPAVEHLAERYTYGELDRWVGRVAEALHRLGAGPGNVVAVCLDRGASVVAAILACLKAGAAYTVVDPALPADRVRFLLHDSRAGVVLTDEATSSRLPVEFPVVLMSGASGPGGAATVPGAVVPAGTAYVMYTSGTTGSPKGVMVGHDHLAGYVDALIGALDLRDPLRYCHVSTFAADLGNSVLFPALCTGGLLLVAGRDEVTDADRLGLTMRRREVDVLKIVPSHLRALLGAARSPADLVPRRYLITGGESLDNDLLSRIRTLSGRCAVVNHYGPTETTVGATCYRVPDGVPDARLGTVPIGRPLAGVEVHVVDRAMQELPAWVTGEVLIGGSSVAHGYLNAPGLTAERFLPDPFGSTVGGRLYRTGDLARWLPSGELQFIGRADRQVKISGYRVELGEIEAAVDAYQPVQQSLAVLDGSDAEAGVVVYVQGDDGQLDVAGLRGHLAARLPAYLQPSAIVPLDRFPLTPNGKIDRAALPGPGTHSRSAGREPANDLERTLLSIWRDVLNRPTVGVTDDFFRSGGSSLRAIRLMSEVEKKTGVNLPLSSLLQVGTVEGIARAVGVRLGSAPRPARQADRRAPFFCVHAGGGGVLGYAELARAMAPERTLVGIESPGLRPGGTMPADVPAMARAYASEIRERQASGPYLVGGWCLGGIIAHELAQQLARQGETVAALVVLDSAAPSESPVDEKVDVSVDGAVDEDLELLGRFAWHYQLDLDDGKLPTMTHDERFAHLLERARSAGVLPPDAGSERFEQLLRVYGHNLRAASAYLERRRRDELARFPVALFRAGDDPVWSGLDDTLGWAGLYGDLVEVITTPGDHHSMLRADRAEQLARRLTGYLDSMTADRREANHG